MKKGINQNKKKEFDGKIDVKKTFAENFDSGMKYWENKKQQSEGLKAKINTWVKELEKLPNGPKYRARRADLRIKIEEESKKVQSLASDKDQLDFIVCIAKVVSEVDKARNEVKAETDKDALQDVKVVPANGPIKQREKRKPRTQNRGNVIKTKSMALFVEEDGSDDESFEQCKRLAQLRHEIPMDQSDVEYCPFCPNNVILEEIEKPPAMCCPMCGCTRDTIDITSAAVHDKETPIHVPFHYNPKQHFEAWINRLTGKSKNIIPKYVIDAVMLELFNMGIHKAEHLELVTWDLVDRILRKLAKKVSTKFNTFYQHVYQITNIIRGGSIITLSPTQRQDLLDMFDVIFESWERNKDPERSNCLSSAFVLQMCFAILGYPSKLIGMFNMLKGPENLKDYDRLVKKICEENGWDWEKVQSAVLANAKYVGDGQNIEDNFEECDEEDNPFLDGTFGGPMLYSGPKLSPSSTPKIVKQEAKTVTNIIPIAATVTACAFINPALGMAAAASMLSSQKTQKPSTAKSMPPPVKKARTASDFLPKPELIMNFGKTPNVKSTGKSNSKADKLLKGVPVNTRTFFDTVGAK
jgi:hypothetical protein